MDMDPTGWSTRKELLSPKVGLSNAEESALELPELPMLVSWHTLY
jgi:hypothetical protein